MYKDLFSQFSTEFNTNIPEDKQIMLLVHAYMIKHNFTKSKEHSQAILNQIKNQNDFYELDYEKNNTSYNLQLKKKVDSKYEVILKSPNRKVTFNLDKDKYFKNDVANLSDLPDSSLESFDNYMNSLLPSDNLNANLNFNNNAKNNLFMNQMNYQNNMNSMNSMNNMNNMNNLCCNNNYGNSYNRNYMNMNNFRQPYFGGINDYGPIPPNNNNNFPYPYMPGYMDGNLMGPNSAIFGQGQPRIRYDPISPFGIGHDFFPPQDKFGFGGSQGGYI